MSSGLVLRLDAWFLGASGVLGLIADLAGYFAGVGPLGALIHDNPLAIGTTEAHGLAVLVAWALGYESGASPSSRHVLAAATHGLLGACNLLFWPVFSAGELLAVGIVTTTAHALFALANLVCLARLAQRP